MKADPERIIDWMMVWMIVIVTGIACLVGTLAVVMIAKALIGGCDG